MSIREGVPDLGAAALDAGRASESAFESASEPDRDDEREELRERERVLGWGRDSASGSVAGSISAWSSDAGLSSVPVSASGAVLTAVLLVDFETGVEPAAMSLGAICLRPRPPRFRVVFLVVAPVGALVLSFMLVCSRW
jgi:hypothetical protein